MNQYSNLSPELVHVIKEFGCVMVLRRLARHRQPCSKRRTMGPPTRSLETIATHVLR
jgi:hypothetical protein